MENWLPLLALLACPIGMGLMMLFMAKGSRSPGSAPRRDRGEHRSTRLRG